jgi:hypothetical protein
MAAFSATADSRDKKRVRNKKKERDEEGASIGKTKSRP